ncbi:heme ABC exporter ATP-binding protein CcmA [Hyphomicrobium sp. MC1]|uniref:heme ABC exporter ATP-binding protein CcmA n=1 Tax=Hyphomicrobium sp. (strain MC1) TaxID=717785 RepID=UPI000213E95C|nr:heme ABC exporter ATP-binding protein CcmA [Hyphomicrobium sp. MC1]CCB67795.1 heme export protein, cytochrome C-type biogenesis ccmA [Hyphomicrobium sp. MC1]
MQLIAEDLTIDRGPRRVIEGLSFDVKHGEALVLTGANGIGKTTLLRTLAGFIRPFRGSVRLEGGDPELSVAEQAHAIGHANSVKSSLTVIENATFWNAYLEAKDHSLERIDAALRHFGLEELGEFPAAYLSAGQKRRLGLSRLLLAHRPLWLLDEPTASLDAASSERLVAAVNAHTREGGLAVIATHLPLALERARTLDLVAHRMAA